MKRHFGIPATGDQNHRGVDSGRPRFEHNTRSNVIHVSFADHQPAPSPDDRSTSGAPVAAAPFTNSGHPFEFGSIVLFCVVVFAPTFFVGAAVLLHALLIAEPI